MVNIIRTYHVRILIGVTFFLFGFFVIANALDMSLRDMMIGLGAGAICGAVMLVVAVGSSIELDPVLRKRLKSESRA
jgi:hypothetical protein